MKILIIYLSIHHQNTQKVINYLLKKYPIKATNLLLTSQNQVIKEIKNYHLIGFASGIYFGKHHRLLFELINKLPKNYNKKAFILSTCGLPLLKFFWHYPIKAKLKEKGFKIIEELSLSGFDTFGFLRYFGGINKGKPNKKDLFDLDFKIKNIIENFSSHRI